MIPMPAATLAVDSALPASLISLIQNAALTAEPPISPDALADKQVASYIRSLSNFTLPDLRTQPQQLQSKSEALHQQLSDLCISQTRAFIHIHQAEQQFGPSLDTFASHLDDLINRTLPELQAAAAAFVTTSQPVLAERERIQNVADQYEHGHLSDLLEIPPLIHTCVKAGHHSDAIQLAKHLVDLLRAAETDAATITADAAFSTSRSDTTHGQRNTYLSLLIEALWHLAAMKADLISSFSKPGLKLPAALKSVAVLRSLTQFEALLPTLADWHLVDSHDRVPLLSMSENQLCLSFLKARIRSLHSALDTMGSPSSLSSQAFLRRYIDLWREELADSLGMAFALFIDDTSPTAQVRSSNGAVANMVTPAYLISSFATSGLERLRETISAQLVAFAQPIQSSSSASYGSANSLETLAENLSYLHTQLSYASASLARFGFDFGTLLCAPFGSSAITPSTASLGLIEATWLNALTCSLDRAFSPMHQQLDKLTNEASLPSRWLVSPQLPLSALQDMYRVCEDNADPSYDDLSQPNIELVDYPPFGKLLNRLLEWINALQVFPPISLAPSLLQNLDRHFARASQRLFEEIPEIIAQLAIETSNDDHVLVDAEAQALLQHFDEQPEAKRTLQTQLLRDRENAMLIKAIRMWRSSVVDWTMNVVASQIFDVALNSRKGSLAPGEIDAVWQKAKQWIDGTQSRIVQSDKQRRSEANLRRKAVQEAQAQAKLKADQEARRKAEEEARLKAEEEARLKAEEEARLKAEEETRLKAEEEARLKAEEEARLKAEEEARLKAEEEARLKAEEEARLKAEEEARLKAEETRLKAEEEAEAKEAARLQAEEEERLKADEMERLKAEAKSATAKDEAARVETAEEARIKAEEEAKVAAQEEAKGLKAKVILDEGAGTIAEDETRSKAVQDAQSVEIGPNIPFVDAETQAAPLKKKDDENSGNSSVAEAATEAAPKTVEQSAPSAASAAKKFSLAEKLRQRKEERDRAAAAAASSTAVSEAKEAAPAQDESSLSTSVVPANESSNSIIKTAHDDNLPSRSEDNHKTSDNSAAPATTEGSNLPTSTADPSDRDEGDYDDEHDDDAAAEEDDSGANTPVTPSTPNPEVTSGSTSAGKKNRKKKKKKK